jgi:hypothetical protein
MCYSSGSASVAGAASAAGADVSSAAGSSAAGASGAAGAADASDAFAPSAYNLSTKYTNLEVYMNELVCGCFPAGANAGNTR